MSSLLFFVAAYSDSGWSTFWCTENGIFVFAPYTELVEANTRCSTPLCRQPSSTRHRALDVAVDVRERVLDAVAHAGLRAEVDHAREFLGGEQLRHAVAVGEIELDELEVSVALEDGEPRVLQRDVVVLVEIVEPDDLVAALEQQLRRVKADESGRAGDEYLQVASLS